MMIEEIESGAQCTHKNTRLRYTVVEVDAGAGELLLEAESEGFEPLTVTMDLFQKEFVLGDRYSGPRRARARRSLGTTLPAPTGPRSKGKIKKMVRDRGFGFIRGENGKEVFFHRSGMSAGDYDALNEGDTVDYVVQEGPRGARAEHVRPVSEDKGAAGEAN